MRIIFSLKGISAYGSNIPIAFYTGDHYDNFIEYANYYGGWSKSFGLDGSSWSAMATMA